MVAPSVRVSARDWNASFVSVCSNSECEREGRQNVTYRGCPSACSGSFSTWGLGLQSMRYRSSAWKVRFDPKLQKNLVTGETWEMKAPASLRRASSSWALEVAVRDRLREFSCNFPRKAAMRCETRDSG